MTAQLDRALDALREEFAAEIRSGLIVHLGTYNCRTKNNDPDGPWSEHAWPNAADVMLKRIKGTRTPTPEAKKVGYRVAAWMRAHPELWSEVFWQIAAHFDHVHGTATPRRNYDNKQVPPCAGGPTDPDPDPGDEDMPLTTDEIDAIATATQKKIMATSLRDGVGDETYLRTFQQAVSRTETNTQEIRTGVALLLKEAMDDEAFEAAVIANILAAPDRFLDKLRLALEE